jgi:hypothetical protein
MAKLSIVSIVEIAWILGVTHRRVSKIVTERGFPKPVGRQGPEPPLDRRDVTAWAKLRAARESLTVGQPSASSSQHPRPLSAAAAPGSRRDRTR